MKVNILLASYNGQSFIGQQIESIQQQTFTDWTLWIRDDGSTDKTLDVVKSYMAEDERIRLLPNPNQKNLGVIKSFHRLLKQEQADYYFFSDQDDVWLPEKLSLCLEKAQEFAKECPLLIYTDLSVVDEQLNVLYPSMIKTQSHHANTNLRQELTENTVTGGTMMINHALAQNWTEIENLLMHDWYLALLATALGQLVYLDTPTELYRQHSDNVLGARTWSKRMKNWLQPHKLVTKYWWLITASQKQAALLLDKDLSQPNRDLIEAYVGLLDKPLVERIGLLKKYQFAKNRWFHTFIFRMLIVTKFAYRRK
ncbi:glycosyltransferase family 2 protein [Streptococcus sp. sy010]|uniref:glycosyltransferase family 2 protein n=1 Tax=Streptococcus sp. sy010 TaxID=2600148 RepID=UPI0011B57E78|nr:glycosyltransferase family 2 protein [Streptococcus sp. sy010]TWT16602.1 glycosyltransferase family 2 protein [Streptococcus sp. sy010]